MRKMFAKMWKDDDGIVAFEYLLVATVIGLALVVGLSAVSIAINAEFAELANAIRHALGAAPSAQAVVSA